MKYFKLILALIASASIVFTAPAPGGAEVCELSRADSNKITALVEVEDCPEQVLSILGDGCPQFSANDAILSNLYTMNSYNRVQSFRALFPRINFAGRAQDITMILSNAFAGHKIEICDYLLSQEFEIEDAFLSIWEDPLRWDIVELEDLVDHHPDRILHLLPGLRYLVENGNVGKVMMMLRFIEHCRAINPAFAQRVSFQPSNVATGFILRNEQLSDADLKQVLLHLFDLGAEVDESHVQTFKAGHPRYVECNEYLAQVNLLNIKEPAN
jgi:hypothetical protein